MAFNRQFHTKKPKGSTCRHCERELGNFAGGYSRGFNNEILCHPNVGNRPDCYALVTRYGHPTPCDSPTCYENHDDLMIYVNARTKNWFELI